MRNGKHRSTPARLARLERRFASWRQNRQRGERIPQRLWQAAARLAADYGVSVTASVRYFLWGFGMDAPKVGGSQTCHLLKIRRDVFGVRSVKVIRQRFTCHLARVGAQPGPEVRRLP